MVQCNHCEGDVAIRNPKGFCDHLKYPENCSICLIWFAKQSTLGTIVIKTINSKVCNVKVTTDKSKIDQEFLIEDLPNLIIDITKKFL